jgi:thioredoxin 1
MVWAENTFPDTLKVVKVNCTDGNKELMEKYKVYGLPCLIVFKNGAQVEGSFKEGAITKKDLIKYLEKNVGLQVPA